ncbi:GNAT family N-acetyltransferase [Shewanella sp. ENK2]|uniref:GNAT family N-acetyltransferase n=1 Tax=Shewanella sp. ENK2 TaxID=2775245 RepID=UPI003749F5AA
MEDKKHSFETDRLIIRLLEEGDRDFFVSLYTDPKIMRHIGEPFSEEKANSSFKTAIKLNTEIPIKQLLWVINDKSSRETCGIQNLSFHYEDKGKAEAGLILARKAQGRFYPEEALVGMVNYGFTQLGLSSIYAYSSVRNRASKRVVTKAGFHQFDETESKVSFKIESE